MGKSSALALILNMHNTGIDKDSFKRRNKQRNCVSTPVLLQKVDLRPSTLFGYGLKRQKPPLGRSIQELSTGEVKVWPLVCMPSVNIFDMWKSWSA